MKIIECPYCHKKLTVSRAQLIFRGRMSMLCPVCHRFLFYAVRKRLVAMQSVMIMVSILMLTGIARMQLPLGGFGKALAFIGGLVLVVALSELCQSWIVRPSLVKRETERYVAQKKAEEAAEKAAQRKKPQHKKKK